MNQIDKITLDYFLNKNQYNQVLEKQNIFQSKQFLKDKRFYRKRILNTTRQLFAEEIENQEIVNSFNNYVKSMINYLKFIDKKDILQEEYSTLQLQEKKVSFEKTDKEKKDDYDKANNMIANIPVNDITLDEYVIKKNEDQEGEILPQKKIINLQDPKLKRKGIKKKEKKS